MDRLTASALVAFAAGEFAADGIAERSRCGHQRKPRRDRAPAARTRSRGDHVAVEDPTFPALLDLLASLGLVPAPFAIDDEGPRPEALERALGPRVPAVVMSSRAQNPTGAAITGTARIRSRSHPPSSSARTADRDRSMPRPMSGASLVTLTAGPRALGGCEIDVEMAGAGSPRRRDDRRCDDDGACAAAAGGRRADG